MLTDTKLKSLRPRAKAYIVSDGRGLYAEVRPSGAVCWRYRYTLRGRQEKLSLGQYPDTSLALAREQRNQAARRVAEGKSPAREKQSTRRLESGAVLVRDYLERWYQDALSKARKNAAGLRYWIDNDILPAIGGKPMNEVNREDLQRLIFGKADSGSPAAAGKIRGLLRQLFDHALHRGLIEANPVLAVPAKAVFRQKARDRVLSADELRQFLLALDASALHRALIAGFRILLLTLTRKGELLNARWSDIDLETMQWTIPASNSKTGKPHVVYLSRQAAELFRELKPLASYSERVLPGRDLNRPLSQDTLNKALARLNIGIEAFNPHDLRRTGATLLAEMGYPGDIIEKALNHVLPGIRGVYNRAEHGDARREMLQRWADYLDSLTAGANVIPLHQKRA